MYKGIYIALSGGVLKNTHLEIISHNLANAGTLGYKKDRISFQDSLISEMNGGSGGDEERIMSDISSVATDFSEGSLIRTGNSLDIAIDGRGFIGVEGDQFTRKGDFRLDRDGYLSTSDGRKVLGSRGPLQLPDGKVEIGNSGQVKVNGVVIDTLNIVDFDDASAVKKTGDDLFSSARAGSPAKSRVRQGYLESSNVDSVREMVGMIDALREFESFQKAIQAFDEATAKVTNDMAKI